MKAILILPEMPNGCAECILARMNVDGEITCAASAGNPGNCQLRALPERYDVRHNDIPDYRRGWNDCLDEIEG